jgi:hypothetical protein
MLGLDEFEHGRVVTGQLGVAAQVVLDPRRLARLQPILQVNVGQLDKGAEAQLTLGRHEGVEVRRRRVLLPGVLEAFDEVGQHMGGRRNGVGQRLIRWAHRPALPP